jgi:ABC-type glycerol-3-phosphate transport system permease component
MGLEYLFNFGSFLKEIEDLSESNLVALKKIAGRTNNLIIVLVFLTVVNVAIALLTAYSITRSSSVCCQD